MHKATHTHTHKATHKHTISSSMSGAQSHNNVTSALLCHCIHNSAKAGSFCQQSPALCQRSFKEVTSSKIRGTYQAVTIQCPAYHKGECTHSGSSCKIEQTHVCLYLLQGHVRLDSRLVQCCTQDHSRPRPKQRRQKSEDEETGSGCWECGYTLSGQKSCHCYIMQEHAIMRALKKKEKSQCFLQRCPHYCEEEEV